jgi:carnitine-CoA ligase
MTIFHRLLRTGAEQYGARPAVLFEGETVGYDVLLARSEALAAGMRALGVSQRDHVAILMDNSLASLLAWLASSVVGCTEIPINPQYRGDLLTYLMKDAEVGIVVCDAAYLPQVAEIAHQLPTLRLVLVNDPVADLSDAPFRCVDLAASFGTGETVPDTPDTAGRIILYTSGTTGPSKGVVHTQRTMQALARYNAETLRYCADDRLLNFFPLFHQNARYTGVLPALYAGASIRLERKLSTSRFWQTCDADGITAFNYLGSVLRLILNATPPERVAGTHTIRKAFGAGAPPDVWEAFETRLGIRLVETYGLSEAPMATLNIRDGDRKAEIGSAGRASDLFDVAIVDGADRILPPGETGEIVLRPRRPDVLMLGYHNKDAATVAAWRNLWFHSGDRGRLSGQGCLFFEEREKDSIRQRGENISAWEVESVLVRHPDVAEVAVYGLPNEDMDEEVAAAIVLRREGVELADILAFGIRHLPRRAVPTLLRVMRELPRTPTEKVQKGALRDAGRAAHVAAADIAADLPGERPR